MPCTPEARNKAMKVLDSIEVKMDSLTPIIMDSFEEAHHPRNAGGTFTKGEGEEPKEDSAEREGLRAGALSKEPK